ncbi:MAG: hypothetical protein V1873_02475 [Verrucomicrobiota bacterium]
MRIETFAKALAVLNAHPPRFEPQPARRDAFLRIGDFLEKSVRAGQPHDLKAKPARAASPLPSPVWQIVEQRLAKALREIEDADLPTETLQAWQMYNDGVIIRAGDVVLGLDVIPMPRFFGWPEPAGLTEKVAGLLDLLLVTHEHEDHYDRQLVGACLRLGKPVFLPEPLARDWGTDPNLFRAGHGGEVELDDLHILARRGVHVWRESADDVPVVYYEVACQKGFRFLFGGDADYTKGMEKTAGADLDLFFLPWRNPSELYEDGHPARIGTTLDAVNIAIERLAPRALLYEHCAELNHVYDGFTPSFDIALDLQRRLPVPSELLFWGETVRLSK